MTRPRKQIVDWFPHDCLHRATLFTLENKYGNDGYAFWFKLLEALGATEGHLIDCKDAKRYEYLCARARLDAATCEEILNLLARMEAIDPGLWNGSRLIWCQNLLDRVRGAYKNRQLPIPKKPESQDELPGLGQLSGAGRAEGEKSGEGEKGGGEEGTPAGDPGAAQETAPAIKPGAGKKHGRAAAPIPPAVTRYREMAHRFPNKSLYGDIEATVGDKPADLDRWGAVVKAWIGKGYNPSNLTGMLDTFRRGEMPGGKPKHGTRSDHSDPKAWSVDHVAS